MSKDKLVLPISILVGCIILGGFLYMSQLSKQRSIEKQQEIKLQEDRRTEEVKAEQTKKEYVAKRKNECYDIYLQEKENWTNVKDFDYSEVRDVCIVKYESKESAKTKEECGEMIKNISEIKSSYLGDMTWNNYFNCLENWFSKEF